MLKTAWDEIEYIYTLPGVDATTIEAFQKLKNTQTSYTKKEGNPRHYCSFFLPYDAKAGKIYLGWHIKADDWIPPGGHIEPGETPSDAAIREMQEELKVKITPGMLSPFNLSVKPINRKEVGCMAHYDIWHLANIRLQDFEYLRSEYHDAGWFSVAEGAKKIAKNPDFAAIVAKLAQTHAWTLSGNSVHKLI